MPGKNMSAGRSTKAVKATLGREPLKSGRPTASTISRKGAREQPKASKGKHAAAPSKKKGSAPGARRFAVLLCENSAWKAYADSPELWTLDAVKLPCSGKIEVGLILKLLEKGNAGVLVLGCPKDNCTYIRGNYRAEKRIHAAKAAIREAGLDENILRFDFISSLGGRALRDVVHDFKGYLNDHSRS